MAISAALLCQSTVAQTLPPPVYGIKHEDPSIGSNIRKYAVRPGKIPINRRYAELTPAEKQLVHAPYEQIAPGDEPPFPAEGLKALFDAIQKGQRYLLVRGVLQIIANVDKNGDVQKLEVLKSPDKETTDFVAKVLMATKFKPAMCASQPCQMEYLLELQFYVDH